jgi:hypothetical protein
LFAGFARPVALTCPARRWEFFQKRLPYFILEIINSDFLGLLW